MSMINVLRPALLLWLLVFSCGAVAQAADLEGVLARLVDAYGGEHKLKKLDSQIQEWDMIALMGNRRATDTRRIRAPGQLRVELRYPDKTEVRIVNGDLSHVIYDQAPARPAHRPQSHAMRLQMMRLYSPLVLRRQAERLSLTSDDEAIVITLSEPGLRVDYMINPDAWRIEKVVGSLTFGGRQMQFVTEYSEFVMQDGVLLHRRENKFVGHVNTAVLSLRKVTLDAPLDDADFDAGGTGNTKGKPGHDDAA